MQSPSPVLVELDADHPGFHDPLYRRRRNEIARAALDYADGDRVPDVVYTGEEQDVWREVWRHLDPLHDRYACGAYQTAARRVSLGRFETEENLSPWNVAEIVETRYDPTMYQTRLFVAPGFERMCADVLAWLARF